MKRCSKLLTCFVLFLAMCCAFSPLVSAAEPAPAVNGGLTAEILTQAQTNNTVPVTVRITNTNAYEVSGVGYTLTASEEGVLSGQTSAQNLTIAAGSSITPEASLQAASDVRSPATGDGIQPVLWSLLAVLSLSMVAFLVIKNKKLRQSTSLLLALVMLLGTFAAIGIPVSAAESSEPAEGVSFTVTKDTVVHGQSVRLSLQVTLPGDGSHTVSFVDSENALVKSFAVPDGGVVPADEIPVLTKSGQSFNGWYLSTNAETPFFSDDPIVRDLVVYPAYSAPASSDTYNRPVCHDAGFVERTHLVVITSERAITTANLADFATLETRFGDAPAISVLYLGDNQYELSGLYSACGSYCWRLTADDAAFREQDAQVREYAFKILGEETESAQRSDQLRSISAFERISLEATADESVSYLNVYGTTFAVDDRLGVPDENGEEIFYKVTQVLGSTTDPESGRKHWRLEVTPCAIEEVYDEIDVNRNHVEADEIIDLSDPEDLANYVQQIERSEEMRVYADYIASAVNDSKTFQDLVEQSYGEPAYIGYQSETMLQAKQYNASANNTADAFDEALELVGTFDLNRPGVNLKIEASLPTIDLDDFNSYWDERYAETGEEDPETGRIVNKGKTDFFGKKFASISTDVTITLSLNGGNKNIAVEAKLELKQSVKICSATKVKLEKGWEIYKGSQIDAGATAYTETSVDFTITLKTDNGGFDISDEIDDIVSAAKGEKYESENRYIRRFRSLYDGSEQDFVEVYRKDFCQFSFSVGPVQINIPVAFVVRFALSAGVGIGYDYRNNYTVGVSKEKDSRKLTPYYSESLPGWEFNFYVAGHTGVQLALNAKLGVTITGCSKIFEIGLEAEFGVRADFYGYFLIREEKNWKDFSPTSDTGGAYYFNAKVYFKLKLFAKTFVFETKWELFSWEYSFYSAGNRYVLLDFGARNVEQKEPIIIPVTKDSKLTTVKDGRVTLQTVAFSLDSYFKSLKPVFFDLQTARQVTGNEETQALLNQYIMVYTGGVLTLPNGVSSFRGSTSVHLRPYNMEPLLDGTKHEFNTSITFAYEGPVFGFGDDKPSVTYQFKIVSQTYLTGERYDVNYWVGDDLYQTKQYLEGTAISPWDSKVDDAFLETVGAYSARFDIPTEKVTKDMDLYATVSYKPNNSVSFYHEVMALGGIREADYFRSRTMAKNESVTKIAPDPGVLAPYFLGWDLEGDNSDELNKPIPGKNSNYVYREVYGTMPTYKVRVVDGATGNVLSETPVTLGESYTIAAPTPPDDGRAYVSEVTCESGDYLCEDYIIDALSVLYPISDVTLSWNHAPEVHRVDFYTDNAITLFETQRVEDGDFITPPLDEEDWSDLDYQNESDGCYEFTGWEIWDGSQFVEASTIPITGPCNVYAVYDFVGIRHNITLLDEDGEEVLYSGRINHGQPLNSGYYPSKVTDKEKTYEPFWKSEEDDSIHVNATESGRYILYWTETPREYNIALDAASAAILGSIDFDDAVQFASLEEYVGEVLDGYTPEKPETNYVTYRYDGFDLYCDANPNGDYGICTVSLLFTAVPKKCAITFDVSDADQRTGTLWFAQNELELEEGLYEFEFTLLESDSEMEILYEAQPADRNYNFVGWKYGEAIYHFGDSISLVGLENITLTAIYQRKPYAVTLDTDGGSIEGDETIYANLNEDIELPESAKVSDAQYTYRFLDWANGENRYTDTYRVTASVTLKARYEETLRSYNIVFNAAGGSFADGTDVQTVLTPYGSVPGIASPTKASTQTQKYTFDGWTSELVAVTGAATYTAKWKTTNLYTLTFNAGNGAFAAEEGASQKTYTVEEGTSFDLGTVPVPYYNYQNEVKKFTGWSPSASSVVVRENAEYAALWSEPVSAFGVLISDGANTEDIATGLLDAQSVPGYTLEYHADNPEAEPFFALEITGEGLTLSGNGAVEWVEVSASEMKLQDFTFAGTIEVNGDCAITIDGTVTLSATRYDVVSLSEAVDSEPYSLSFVGADDEAKLIVNAEDGARGIASGEGNLTIRSLDVELTAREFGEDPEDMTIPVAMGSLDTSGNLIIEDSTVLIHKGYLSGKLQLKNSTIEFDDNAYNGLLNVVFDYSPDPVTPDYVLLMENSTVLFHGRAYLQVEYQRFNSDPPLFIGFFKVEGQNEEGIPILGWFESEQELQEKLDAFEEAWIIRMDETSSFSIEE